jgi:hypothetical protein
MNNVEKRSVRKSGFYKARKRAESKALQMVSVGIARHEQAEKKRIRRMKKRVVDNRARPFTLGELLCIG